ncbi:MAG: SDR family oxidoreductase [Acidobacteria bacterium]|nr:MAG: SDR family oxidoreductase [Acidobacteriota bacterium]
MDIKGKRAVVTGGTKGIGRAIAEALLAEQARVAIAARSKREVEETVAALEREHRGRVIGRPCDVGKLQDVEQLFEYCLQQWQGIDILINNAGIGIFKTVEELRPEEWRSTLSTNLDSLFYSCHLAIPLLKNAGGGFIINIGSLAGKNAFAGGAAYNASKFGLIGFSEALMQEVRHDDILVAYIMPGSVDTGFGAGMGSPSASWKIASSDVAEVVVQTLKRHPRCLTSRIEMRPSKPPKK